MKNSSSACSPSPARRGPPGPPSSASLNIGPNDGYTFAQGGYVSVKPNDTLTLLAGTYTIQTFAGFNPQCTQTFTGNVFVINGSGSRASNIVAAPESTTWAAGALTVLAGGLAVRRRLRAAWERPAAGVPRSAGDGIRRKFLPRNRNFCLPRRAASGHAKRLMPRRNGNSRRRRSSATPRSGCRARSCR